MERNVRYVWIGVVFFIILIFMLIFVLWFNRFEIDSSKYMQYYAYTSNEVKSIGTNTPIYYKGISIGRVNDVSFKNIQEGIIQIEMFIDASLIIYKNAKVAISSEGLAGSNYLSLIQGNGEEVLQKNEEGRRVIALDKRGFEKIITKASELGDDVSLLLKNLNDILNQENILEIHMLLKNLHVIMENIQSVSMQIDRGMKNGEYNMREILAPTLLQLQGSLQNMSKFFIDASAFLNKVDKNPYDSLFGKESKSSKEK